LTEITLTSAGCTTKTPAMTSTQMQAKKRSTAAKIFAESLGGRTNNDQVAQRRNDRFIIKV
jgi:hypothetical protein